MTAPRIIPEQVSTEGQVSNLQLPIRFKGNLKIGDTKPSVKNMERWKAVNTGAVTVTDFSNGQEGQHIMIRGDGHTTVSNNSNIKTNTGANKLLAADKVYSFVLFDGEWVEHS